MGNMNEMQNFIPNQSHYRWPREGLKQTGCPRILVGKRCLRDRCLCPLGTGEIKFPFVDHCRRLERVVDGKDVILWEPYVGIEDSSNSLNIVRLSMANIGILIRVVPAEHGFHNSGKTLTIEFSEI